MDVILVFRTGTLGSWRSKFAGIMRFAKTKNWRVQVIDPADEAMQVKKLLAFWNPVGCIVEASCDQKRFRLETFGSMPVVFMNCDPAPIGGRVPCVVNDSPAIAELAARELMAMNRASYAFVDWFEPTAWAEKKRWTFLEIMRLHGAECSVLTPPRKERARPLMLQKRLRKWLTGLPKPCGIFAVTDFMAEATLAAAADSFAVPDDVAVIGVDDDEDICENTNPTLSSVRPDFERLGMLAARNLEEEISVPGSAARLLSVKPVGVTRRCSTRGFFHYSPSVRKACEHIRCEACSGLKAADVTRFFGCSPRMAEIRFKRATGHSIRDEILAIRFERAFDYLREGDSPISVVSDFCGWKSSVVFRKIFKARTGLTPGAWRRANPRFTEGEIP